MKKLFPISSDAWDHLLADIRAEQHRQANQPLASLWWWIKSLFN